MTKSTITLDVSGRLTAQVSDAQLDAICELKAQYWDYSLSSQRAWFERNARLDDVHVLGTAGGRLLAYLRLVSREALIADGRALVNGVSTVCVARDFAGQGLGRTIVSFTNGLIDARPGAIGVLQCSVRLTGFYAACGWRPYSRSVRLLDPARTCRPFLRDEIVMVYSRATLPDAEITILGDGF